MSVLYREDPDYQQQIKWWESVVITECDSTIYNIKSWGLEIQHILKDLFQIYAGKMSLTSSLPRNKGNQKIINPFNNKRANNLNWEIPPYSPLLLRDTTFDRCVLYLNILSLCLIIQDMSDLLRKNLLPTSTSMDAHHGNANGPGSITNSHG